MRFAGVCDFYVERDRTPGRAIAEVEHLAHDFVAEIQVRAVDPGLIRCDEQAQKLRRASRFTASLAELGDLVQLTNRRLAIDVTEHRPGDRQDGNASAAKPAGGVR